MRKLVLFILIIAVGDLFAPTLIAQEASTPTVTRIASQLSNPRGVAVLADGRLVVAEAGSGRPAANDGRLSIFDDLNGDGDYDDPDERITLQDNIPSYNAYIHFNPGRDEVLGIGDIALLDEGRIIYTLDDNFENIHVVEFNIFTRNAENVAVGLGTLNALVPHGREFYVAESSLNMISNMNTQGKREVIAQFPTLANNQQAVPAGMTAAGDDLLVALFSGQLFDYYGNLLSYMVGDSKIVRVNPDTGDITDEITGLTTAIDVAIDENGNIFVVEMTTRWAPAPLYRPFDLYDPASPPDDGGYPRFSGQVTMYPADDSAPISLATNLDTPTNITYHDGALYVSTGQGTPGRRIVGLDGFTQIEGALYRISGY